MMHFAVIFSSFVAVVPINDICSLRSCFHLTDVIPLHLACTVPKNLLRLFQFSLLRPLYFSGPSFVSLAPNLQAQELPFFGCPSPCFEYVCR
jgi:hypothetical protein